jgi:MFS family permease
MATKLTRQQKEAITLLSFGTLLEYFDLLLYVHLSILLNDLFFPKTDPMMAKLLGATAFCMTFVLRPVGGYVIGRIGDAIGRKTTIYITTFIMAGTCLTMAMLPTYEKIGIWATIAILLCRMFQGFSSLGEVIGAGVYLFETLKSPHKYIANAIIDMASRVGGFFALGVASLVLNSSFNWRYAFFIGAGIAIIGFVARTRLRETTEFANYQCRMKVQKQLDTRYVANEKVNKKALVGLFLNVILTPICFYCTYIYLGDFMKSNLGMTSEEVVTHNFKISIYSVLSSALLAYLCGKFHPIKIVKTSIIISIMALLYMPYCLNNIISVDGEMAIYFLQCLIYIPAFSNHINVVIWLKYLPVSKRFTTAATTFGCATAIGYTISSYGLIPLTEWFGYYGVWALCAPVVVGFIWALSYLTKLEKDSGAYGSYPSEPRNRDTALNDEDFHYELDKEYEKYNNKCVYSTNLLSKLEVISKEDNVKLNMDRQHNLETIEGLEPHKQQKMAKETNRHFIKWLAVIGDKLGITERVGLEYKMHKLDEDILKIDK